MKDSENHWTKEARHNKTKYCILGMLQLILIICRFCVCEFIYLLQCIRNLWINTHGAFMVIFVDTCKAMKHLSHCEAPNVHNAIWDGTKGLLGPSCFDSPEFLSTRRPWCALWRKPVFSKICSGMTYYAVGCEFNGNESTDWLKNVVKWGAHRNLTLYFL